MSDDIKKYIDKQEDFYQDVRKEKSRKMFYRISKSISIIIILIAVVMVIQRSIIFIKRTNLFNINNLIIKGNIHLTFNDIIEVMDIQSGDNIFHVQLKELKEKLEYHPRVKSVDIKRELPGKIVINIVERKPIVLLNARKDFNYCLYEIDEEGFIIGEYPNIFIHDLPVITGDCIDNAILGEKLTHHSFKKVLTTLAKIEKQYYDFKRYIAEVNINCKEDHALITLYLNYFNVKVEFGENFTVDKLNKLNSLLMVIGKKMDNLEYIDFKYNEAVGKYRS